MRTQADILRRTHFLKVNPGPAALRRILCDTTNPGGKNYLLEHPKFVEWFRHLTEIPGGNDEYGHMLLTKADGEEVIMSR